MWAVILRRLTVAVMVALAVSVVTFGLSHVAIDPALALAGDSATDLDVEAIRERYGFDRPLVVQYADYLWRLLQLDFGTSYLTNRPVLEMIAERLPATALLAALSIAFALALAIPLGVSAALRPDSIVDRFALFFAVAGQSIPNFWAGLLLILLFGVQLRWLPISGNDTWAHFVMPAIALGYYSTPALMRLTRAGMIEVLKSDYIRTARAKGLRPPTVMFKHALRNAILPVVSLTAVQFGFALGGSIVIETIFNLKGIGWLSYDAILRADLPVVQAIVLVIACFYVVLTLAADLLNAALDPRIRVR